MLARRVTVAAVANQLHSPLPSLLHRSSRRSFAAASAPAFFAHPDPLCAITGDGLCAVDPSGLTSAAVGAGETEPRDPVPSHPELLGATSPPPAPEQDKPHGEETVHGVSLSSTPLGSEADQPLPPHLTYDDLSSLSKGHPAHTKLEESYDSEEVIMLGESCPPPPLEVEEEEEQILQTEAQLHTVRPDATIFDEHEARRAPQPSPTSSPASSELPDAPAVEIDLVMPGPFSEGAGSTEEALAAAALKDAQDALQRQVKELHQFESERAKERERAATSKVAKPEDVVDTQDTQ